MARTRSGRDCPPPRRRLRSRLVERRPDPPMTAKRRRWHRRLLSRWPLRALLWIVGGTAGWLLAGPAAAGAGLLVLEIAVLAVTLRRVRSNRPRGGGWRPPDAGVREPRRPLPTAGAGAMALPLPGSGPLSD